MSESKKDWTEDFDTENGNYHNQCMSCKEMFWGHKRRVQCKECAEPRWVEMTNEEIVDLFDIHEKSKCCVVGNSIFLNKPQTLKVENSKLYRKIE